MPPLHRGRHCLISFLHLRGEKTESRHISHNCENYCAYSCKENRRHFNFVIAHNIFFYISYCSDYGENQSRNQKNKYKQIITCSGFQVALNKCNKHSCYTAAGAVDVEDFIYKTGDTPACEFHKTVIKNAENKNHQHAFYSRHKTGFWGIWNFVLFHFKPLKKYGTGCCCLYRLCN